MKIFYIHF